MSLPSPHHGETVVEPGMVNGRDVDLTGAPTFVPRTRSVIAVRMTVPFFVDAVTFAADQGRPVKTYVRQVGGVGDILMEIPTETGPVRCVMRAAEFESNYQEVQ